MAGAQAALANRLDCFAAHQKRRRPGPPSGGTATARGQQPCVRALRRWRLLKRQRHGRQVAAGFHQHQRAFVQHHHGGRSRGTWMGLGSAAIAACTAAILSTSEFTHCRPDEAATCCSASTGSVNACTRGRPPLAGALAGAAAGAGVTAAGAAGAAATGAAAAATGAGAAATGAAAVATASVASGAAATGAAGVAAGALK